MRLPLLAALPVALSLLSFTAAFTDHEHVRIMNPHDSHISAFSTDQPGPFAPQSLDAREDVEAVATRELLTNLSTRDLLAELTERLERRGPGGLRVTSYRCTHCGQWILAKNKRRSCPRSPTEGAHEFK
ncbi:hypothetical protein DFP72DRAFT_642455 [Ephemerocybe angulata]|uniref:Uncharacterized protein n=1 Tax=Ephemerocybe angulata TaxID=980116 RepID=A0A8H6HHK6_9AGAR|nr:hypothetical protein DFP72DRAFT_642455 [Tulosesus angulatus]